jgi:hypothetical protein
VPVQAVPLASVQAVPLASRPPSLSPASNAPYDLPPELAQLMHLTEDDGCYFLITPEGLRAGQSSDLP